MAKKEITLADVMRELKIIKKLSLKDLQVDIEDEHIDKLKTGKPKTAGKKIFDNIYEWEAEIWDECTHKKTLSKNKEFEYICELQKKTCKFNSCPLNIKKQ